MAIQIDARGVRMLAAGFLVRAFVFLLGVGAIAWGGSSFPLFWQQRSLSQIASELLRGDTFKIQTLVDEARGAEKAKQSSFCSPTYLHDVVVLRLAILSEAMTARNQKLIETGYDSLSYSTRSALSCAPSDSFAWLCLFWVDAAKHGFRPENANYLRLSYASGPNEGWIALRRNRLAIALFQHLPADLSTDAVNEFIRLLDTGSLYPETVAIFASATPAVQRLLVEHLKSAKSVPRQIFATTLRDNGINIDIPGVDRPSRPWQ
jgi:hypothetical protein